MKRIIPSLIFLTCFFFLSAERTKASHAVGADLTFQYVAPNEYIVTVKFFRDCSGQPAAPPTTFINVNYSSSCGNGSATLNAVAGTGLEISTSQFPPCVTTSCNGGLGYGVTAWVYEGTVILPAACADWVFSITINARNASINTVTNPGVLNLYIEATLDNANNPTDASPVFSTPPVARFCVNYPFTYTQGATDPDGDSLVYSLVDALTNAGTIVPYMSPYTGLNPIASSPPVTIDPQTGTITLNPTMQQVGVIAVLVEEYRNGVLIGSVRRDMQINIELTCNFPPLLTPATFNNTTAHCNDTVIYIHLTTPVFCNSVDSDGTDFRLYSPTGLMIPIIREEAINCAGNLTDSLKLFLYPPYLYQNGTWIIYSKVGNDGNTLLNGCGNSMLEYDTARFEFHDCYTGKVDITNVSVDYLNEDMVIAWVPPADTVWPARFLSFDIYRSDVPPGPYFTMVGSIYDSSITIFTDTLASIPSRPYNYEVLIHLMQGYTGLISDSIQSIYLTGDFNGDSLTIDLQWTPYWGWANPEYHLMQSDNNGATFTAVSGSSTHTNSMAYSRPLTKGTYIVRIESVNGTYLARSNWYKFDIIKLDVVASNVFTPNGDGLNDSFTFENLDNYPNSELNVFNRWGRKIYESSNYLNDWKAESFPEGVYFYTLKIADKKSSKMTGTVSIIRNK